jgi:3-dehydroquinate dehydratase-2
MNILILQGPNLNLLGLQSANNQKRLTLDKLNKALRLHVRSKDINLKFFQSHKEFQAINFIQRNRNWADGLVFIPTTWAINNFTLLETIKIIKIKTSLILFEEPFSFGVSKEKSILNADNILTFCGTPIETCLKGLNHISS